MKGWLAAGAAAALLAVALAIPASVERYDAPIPREERARNAAILVALEAAGIAGALVDAQEEAVIILYDAPGTTPVDDAQRLVLGIAAPIAAEDATLHARTGDTAWRVAARDVVAYQAGVLDRAMLEARVVRE